MSIRIERKSCVGCRACVEACPGNLIKIDSEGRAFIRRPEDCWGCASCMKECHTGSIFYFLGADIGGRGGAYAGSKRSFDLDLDYPKERRRTFDDRGRS